MLILVISAGILLSIIVYTIILYNHLIILKNNVQKNWSNIDVLLKQRNSELSKLIDVCKTYMQYEKETLLKITEARNILNTAVDKQDVVSLNKAESDLKLGMQRLLALLENYPNLKADSSFLNLQGRISELEVSIADRREFYNESVNLNNIAIEQFPEIIFARAFGFKAFDLLKFSEEEKQDVDVKKGFN